jgi:lipid-binding SYLF domain-containing protein
MLIRAAMIFSLSLAMLGCSSDGPSPSTAGQRLDSARATSSTLAGFQDDAKASEFFGTAYAYAVFPKVTKGALVIGVASGRGEVYQGDALVGYAELTNVTVGAQIGGQTFSEIIFFQTESAFTKFTDGQFTGQASVGAVAGKSGRLKVTDYNEGVAIFINNNNGLIAAADIGGQQFKYEAK